VQRRRQLYHRRHDAHPLLNGPDGTSGGGRWTGRRLGRATHFGFVERDSQLDVAGFLLALLLCGGTHDGGRPRDVLRAYLEQGHGHVERSACYARFNDALEAVLVALLDRAIAAGQAQPTWLPGILAGVTDGRVFDSETIKLPKGAYAEYPGGGEYAAIKVHK
jgi:hypothetical protein